MKTSARNRERLAEALALRKTARKLVEAAVKGDRTAAALAFGRGSGPAHSDGSSGIADLWLKPRQVKAIERVTLENIGRKIGTRPPRT